MKLLPNTHLFYQREPIFVRFALECSIKIMQVPYQTKVIIFSFFCPKRRLLGESKKATQQTVVEITSCLLKSALLH